MTTFSKTLILAALALAVGIGAYGSRRVSDLQSQVQTLRKGKDPLIGQASVARQELDEAVSNLAVIQQQKSRLVVEHFPTNLSQLQPYFESPIDDAILQRWEILTGDKLRGLGIQGPTAITQKASADGEYDARWGISLNGSCRTGWRPVSP